MYEVNLEPRKTDKAKLFTDAFNYPPPPLYAGFSLETSRGYRRGHYMGRPALLQPSRH